MIKIKYYFRHLFLLLCRFVYTNKELLHRESCDKSHNVGQEIVLVGQGQHLPIARRDWETRHSPPKGGNPGAVPH